MQIGDEFIVEGKYSLSVQKVTKVTPKRFEVGGITFNKNDGYQVGGENYSRSYLKESTPELVEEMKKEIARKKMVSLLKMFILARLIMKN